MKTFQVLYLAETEIFIKLQPEGVSNFRQNDMDATTMNGKIRRLWLYFAEKNRENVASNLFGGNGNILETLTGSFKLPSNRRCNNNERETFEGVYNI